jgi:DMSO reductase anchor subunit
VDRAKNVGSQVLLVLFPTSVGCLLGSLVIDSGFAARGFDAAVSTVAVVFALAAAVSPVSGIRRPARAYRFLRGVGRSPLSRQALLVGLFTLLLVIHWALALAGTGSLAFGVVAAVVGFAAVLSVGLTYWLRSQPGWRHWSTLASLFGGALAVGVGAALVIALAWPDSLPAGYAAIRAGQALVIAGGGVLALAIIGRSVYLSRGGAPTREIWALTRGAHRKEHLATALLVIVTVIAAAVSYAWPGAIAVGFLAALAAQSLQWRLFFVTAVPMNWRTEVQWSFPPKLVGREA